MEFDDDPVKATVNLKKHKVSVGAAGSVFTHRRGKYRIICALATRRERKTYDEG